MRTDLIPPSDFTPIHTKAYVFGTVTNGKDALVLSSIIPDNAPEWAIEDAEKLGFTTSSIMKSTIQQYNPSADGTDYVEIPLVSMPSDSSYFSAWRYEPNSDIGNGVKGIGINTATAKELHKTLIRMARRSKLTELDIQFQRALESGASTTDIVTKKNTLRDFPAQVDALNVTETTVVGVTTQIRAVWDTDLLGPFTFMHGISIDDI